MIARIAAISFIFICTSIAWLVLGGTIQYRTNSSTPELRDRVQSTWGAPHEQRPPTAEYEEVTRHPVDTVEGGRKIRREVERRVTHRLPVESSRLFVGLDLEHRRKGLLWYSTYKASFVGEYVFQNVSGQEREVRFEFPFPAQQTIYDDLAVRLDGKPARIETTKTAFVASARVAAGAATRLRVSYRSHGLDSWKYSFGSEIAQIRDFELKMTTNFKGIDFPDNTLSPTSKHETGRGWELVWNYRNLISGFHVAVTMPQRLQPGPLAGQISFFAPVSLFFFFFLMWTISTLRGVELHPVNYFFLAAAFFAFHLLLAYLVDHISIHVAFVIASAVSVFLVVSYLRLVTGMRFAVVEAASAQIIYLVLFSYAFFFKGFTGLAVSIGSVLTLFVVMQMTGRIRWSERFAGSVPPARSA